MRLLASGWCGLTVLGMAGGPAMAATFDGDDYGDVFFVDRSGSFYWYESDGTNNTLAAFDGGTGRFTGSGRNMAAGLVDDDATMDLLVGRTTQVSWYEANGLNNGYVANNAPSSLAIEGIAIGKFDRDDRGDVFFLDGGLVFWSEGGGANNLESRRNGIRLTTDGIAIATGDIDGDGWDDLLVTKATSMDWYRGAAFDVDSPTTPDPIFSYVASFTGLPNVQDVAIGDFNGDGGVDLFIVNAQGQVQWLEYLGLDANGTSALYESLATFDSDASAVALGDVDGDGVVELLVGHVSTGVAWYEATSTDTLQSVAGTSFGPSGVYDIVIVPVPEPAAASLLAAAGLGLLMRRR